MRASYLRLVHSEGGWLDTAVKQVEDFEYEGIPLVEQRVVVVVDGDCEEKLHSMCLGQGTDEL